MARDLRARLKRLTEQGSDHQTPGEPVSGGQHLTLPAEWNAVAPLVFTRHTEVVLPGPSGAGFQSRLLGRRVAFRELCFMDTETTGLSGGAGTLVFLVGSAHYRDGVVTVQQSLLGDFPGEPAYLQIVHDQLWKSGIWVSYNGKAFDSRLIETRFLMNGRQVTIPEQLDLLFWARRLWRRIIGPCSLGDIEREILGVSRANDLPGIEIPDRYFEFLKTGDPAGLLQVFAHHLADIVSLVRLFLHLESALDLVARAGMHADLPPLDRIGLGKHLVLRGGAGGEALLRGAIARSRPGEAMIDRERAAAALSRALRRNGRGAESAELWEHLWTEGSSLAGIEFAKHLEHRVGKVREAAAIVESLLSRPIDQRVRDHLLYRLARLRRKLGR